MLDRGSLSSLSMVIKATVLVPLLLSVSGPSVGIMGDLLSGIVKDGMLFWMCQSVTFESSHCPAVHAVSVGGSIENSEVQKYTWWQIMVAPKK